MGVHTVVHRQRDGPLKLNLPRLHPAPGSGARVETRRVTFVQGRVSFASFVITTPHWPWVSESELAARRARSLMEDNPTAG